MINPDEYIDCGVCIPECLVNAIVEDDNCNEKDFYFELNHRLSQKWPNIVKSKDPLPEAENYKNVNDKLKLLEE